MRLFAHFARTATLTALASLLLTPQQAAAADILNDMTGPWQLFIDDHLISSRSDVVRTYHPFKKHPDNPVIPPDKPWMDHVVKAGPVLPMEDGSGFRMWHSCWTPRNLDPDHRSRPLYSTSVDGVHWDMPLLRMVPWVDGSLDNNILPQGAHPMHTPFNQDPKRRYTSMGGGCTEGYCVKFSPDGIHWEAPPDARPLTGGGDVANFHYDPNTGQYAGYVKLIFDVSGLRRRCVGLSLTKDPTSWPVLEPVMAPDDFDDRWTEPGSIHRTHFYGCKVFAYQTMYLGLIEIFRAEDDRGYFHGPVFTELVSSRDGIHWLREEGDRPPMIELGPPGSWDQAMNYPHGITMKDDTIMVYYTGSPDHHDVFPIHGGVGLGTLRKDGFVSLDSGIQVARVTTKRLRNASGPLRVNCDGSLTGIGGYLQVEVMDANGRVLPGYSRKECDALGGDNLDAIVTWGVRKELPTNAGPIRLSFLMKNTSLYSFMAGEKVEVIDDDPVGETLAALYTFDNDPRRSISDVLDADGRQQAIFRGYAEVDSEPKNAAFGERSLNLGSPFRPLNRIEIEDTTQLGRYFTLACMVKSDDNIPARLFSNYDSSGPVNCSELVFDFDPRGRAHAGLRLMCKGIIIESDPVEFTDKKYHHLALTYDDGLVYFYLDGRQVGRRRIPGGAPVALARNLMVGEDEGLGTDEQLTGHLDDLLVLGRALTPDEVKTLSTKGAAALFKER